MIWAISHDEAADFTCEFAELSSLLGSRGVDYPQIAQITQIAHITQIQDTYGANHLRSKNELAHGYLMS